MNVRQTKMILRGFEQHFILLSFLTVTTALILITVLVTATLWLIDPMLIGDASLEDAIYMGILGVAILATTYYYTLRINHKVAGPVWVLMRNLERIGEGDLTTEMRLRHQDHLKEIAASFNENMNKLKISVHGLKQTASALQNSNDIEESKKLVEKLCADLDKLKTE